MVVTGGWWIHDATDPIQIEIPCPRHPEFSTQVSALKNPWESAQFLQLKIEGLLASADLVAVERMHCSLQNLQCRAIAVKLSMTPYSDHRSQLLTQYPLVD